MATNDTKWLLRAEALAINLLAAGMIAAGAAVVAAGALSVLVSPTAGIALVGVSGVVTALLFWTRARARQQAAARYRAHLDELLRDCVTLRTEGLVDRATVDDYLRSNVLGRIRDNIRHRKTTVFVSVLKEEGPDFTMPLSVGHTFEASTSLPDNLPKEESFSWITVLRRRAVECKDIRNDERFIPFDDVEHPSDGSMFSIPISLVTGSAAVFNTLLDRKKVLTDLERAYLLGIGAALTKIWPVREAKP